MLRIMASRQKDDGLNEASLHLPKNKLSPTGLTALFEARQSVTTRKELESLAESFNLDVKVIEGLKEIYNIPTVENVQTRVRREDETFDVCSSL